MERFLKRLALAINEGIAEAIVTSGQSDETLDDVRQCLGNESDVITECDKDRQDMLRFSAPLAVNYIILQHGGQL